jgi:RND family efflux transporter MFP subunit
MKKKVIIIVVLVLLLLGAVVVIKNKKAHIAKTPAMAAYPLPVEVAGARAGSISISSHYLGTVVPYQFAEVAPRITGNLLTVMVREGDRVHKGQLVATIDDRTLKERESAQELDITGTEAQLAGAKSLYETQQGIFGRDEMLYKETAISREAFDRSRAQRDAAYAQLISLEEKVKSLRKIYNASAVETSYARLTSPLDGVVAKRFQEPGELAVPGKPVVRIEGLSQCKVVVQVAQAEMELMKRGGPVVLADGNNKMEAVISRVYPAVSSSALGTIEIDRAKHPFSVPAGASVGVDVGTGKTDAGVIIPLRALLENQSGSFVYNVEGDKIKVTKVGVLGKNNDYAAVTGDIKAGDAVAVGDEGKLMRLNQGMAVKPQKQADDWRTIK